MFDGNVAPGAARHYTQAAGRTVAIQRGAVTDGQARRHRGARLTMEGDVLQESTHAIAGEGHQRRLFAGLAGQRLEVQALQRHVLRVRG